MKSALLILAALLLAVCLLIIWMAGGFQNPKTFEAAPETIGSAPPVSSSTGAITLVSWNVAWAFGLGSEGTKSPTEKTRADFQRTLDAIGDALRERHTDIALLQELDFNSGRALGMDQARAIATRAGLMYVARAESWRANYVPFPYWPPSAHFGHMSSGGAILSRFPIKRCEVTLLDKPEEYPFWYRMFYLFRYVQSCELEVESKTLRIINTHLEAFSPKNRMAQAKTLAQIVESGSGLTVFGGDLNTVPPESPMLSGYPDEPETDHTNDKTLPTLRAIPGFRELVSTEAFTANPESYLTFPADAPNRMLDHLFVSDAIQVESAAVPREIGALSDHLPLVAKIRLTAAQN